MASDSTTQAAPQLSPHRLRLAARVLGDGGVIAHATEGVWGLACDPLNPVAVARLLEIKRRPIKRGLILIGAEREQLAPFVADDAEVAWHRALSSWPGPHTWLLPAHAHTPAWLTGAHDTIALRQTAHSDSAALCRMVGHALVSTSLNRSGRPPVLSATQARARFGNELDLVLGGALELPGQPSSIHDARSGARLR